MLYVDTCTSSIPCCLQIEYKANIIITSTRELEQSSALIKCDFVKNFTVKINSNINHTLHQLWT